MRGIEGGEKKGGGGVDRGLRWWRGLTANSKFVTQCIIYSQTFYHNYTLPSIFSFLLLLGGLGEKMAQRSILLDRQNRMSAPQKRHSGEWRTTLGPATPHHRTGLAAHRHTKAVCCYIPQCRNNKLISDIQNLTQRLAVTTLNETVTCHRKPILQQQKHFKKRKKRKKKGW